MNGETLRDIGLEQAGSGVSAVALVLWRMKAEMAIITLSLADATFSAEDLRRQVGDPPTPNAIGAIFRWAYKKGMIVPDGVTTANRSSRHASLLRLWRRKQI